MKSIKTSRFAAGNGSHSEFGGILSAGTSDSREISGIIFPVVISVKLFETGIITVETRHY